MTPRATYPRGPGFKTLRPETSAQAAVEAEPSCEDRRSRCLEALGRRDMTADEIAAELGLDRLSVRPRVTELVRAGKVRDSGARRRNSSGKTAAVWTLADTQGSLPL